MKKIVTILGARPQFVKAAVVSKALQASKALEEILVHTGQHYDANMSQIFFDELEIPQPHFHLGVGSGLHSKQTGDMMAKIEQLLLEIKPEVLLIYGDTNSTLAGALAAAKLHVPIAHIEAGLRSYNRRMPEEINRIIADQLSTLLFAPTAQAVQNLKKEGYMASRILEVGDVMYDAALFYLEKALQKSEILKQLGLKQEEYILATIHRAENTDDLGRLKTIFTALERISRDKSLVLPLHPRTRNLLNRHFPGWHKETNLQVIEPVGLFDMILLEKHAALIMTDSGGVQKEAFFYRTPCLTLRDQTEWVETVELGWNRLVSPVNGDKIYEEALQALNRPGEPHQKPFGNGDASRLIADHLQGELPCVSG